MSEQNFEHERDQGCSKYGSCILNEKNTIPFGPKVVLIKSTIASAPIKVA